MKTRFKNLVFLTAKSLGLFRFCKKRSRKSLRILCYHGIWEYGEQHVGDALFMSPAKFSDRMQLLHKLGFPVLDLDDAVKRMKAGSLPDNAVAITIDDGWFGTYKYMLPEFERHGFPATTYITTYYVEKELPIPQIVLRYIFTVTNHSTIDIQDIDTELEGIFTLSDDEARDSAIAGIYQATQEWEEVRFQKLCYDIGVHLDVPIDGLVNSRIANLVTCAEIEDMVARGFDVQLHTHRHRTRHNGKITLSSELRDNRSVLEPLVGKKLEHFCYPSGNYYQEDFSILQSEGILSSTSCDTGFCDSQSDVLILKRILDAESVSNVEFEAELCGFGELSRDAKRRFSKLVGFGHK